MNTPLLQAMTEPNHQALPIGATQIRQAKSQAQIQQRRTLEVLEEMLAVDQAQFIQSLSHSLHYVPITMKEMHVLVAGFEVIPFSKAQQKECLAFYNEQNELLLVFADPFNEGIQDWALENIKQTFSWRLAHRSDIAAYLALHEETVRAMDGISATAQHADDAAGEAITDLSFKTISKDSNPIVKLINSTLYDALKAEASDIHLECTNSGLVIKYRIDGVMANLGGLQGQDNADQAISRVKVMAQLDISERRVPQDGRFKVVVQGREVDFRVSIMPSIFGEDAVLRVLDRKSLSEEVQGLS